MTERELNLLNETKHDLASTLALQDLLRTIVSRARSLVGANIFAYLTRLNEEHTVMRTVAAEGLISPVTWELSANVGVGAVSLIVSSKSFFDTQDYLGDQRFRHTESFDRAFKAESIVSLAGFPILSEDKLQGILFVADRYHRKLSGREISVLGVLRPPRRRRDAQCARLHDAVGSAHRGGAQSRRADRPHPSSRRFRRGA